MMYTGKLTGLVSGYLFGLPGMLFCILIGHLFDIMQMKSRQPAHSQTSPRLPDPDIQKALAYVLYSTLTRQIWDNFKDPRLQRIFSNCFMFIFKMNSENKKQITGLLRNQGFQLAPASCLALLLEFPPRWKKQGLMVLCMVSLLYPCSDEQAELKIHQTGLTMGLDPCEIEGLQARAAEEASLIQILDVDDPSDNAAVKRSYRLLAKRFHPDTLTDLGKRHQDIAAGAFSRILEAYKKLSGNVKDS